MFSTSSMTFHVRGLFCFVSHSVKPKTEHLIQPFFSLTKTSCKTITDVLGRDIKTEILSVFSQRNKSVLELGKLANVLCMRAFYPQSVQLGQIAYISLSNEPSVLSTQPKNIAPHRDCQL